MTSPNSLHALFYWNCDACANARVVKVTISPTRGSLIVMMWVWVFGSARGRPWTVAPTDWICDLQT